MNKFSFLLSSGIEAAKYMTKKTFTDVEHPKKADHKAVHSASWGNDYLYERLSSGDPFLSIRFGAVELRLFYHIVKRDLGLQKRIPQKWLDVAFLHAGIFSDGEASLNRFKQDSIKALQDADLFLAWGNYMEDYFLRRYPAKKTREFSHLEAYEAFRYEKPWTKALEGKKVLIVTPFDQSVRAQYEKRALLFPNGALPNFASLETVRAPQTINAESLPKGKTWVDILDNLIDECLAKDFDIALIGCGGYGMVLADALYRNGKQALHLGGTTQTLFGILGKRWEQRDYMKPFINEHWVRPGENERPGGFEKVEDGCYW